MIAMIDITTHTAEQARSGLRASQPALTTLDETQGATIAGSMLIYYSVL